MSQNQNKIVNATKWSAISEIAAKMVSPVSNMILARLLAPDAFGVVATATMIFSFVEMLTDAGFQKYLIQHEFKNMDEMEKTISVAFWTNMVMSMFFWMVICIFNEALAAAVGNPGLGIVFVVSCVSLPLTSISSIQMTLYKRSFDYKTLFYVRIISVVMPLIITVPLAAITRSFWAIIIGTICGNVSNAIILTWKSTWRPRLFYDFIILKKMLSFSIWSLLEAITIWLTNYIGVFLVGRYLSVYHLGLYKMSMNTVNQIMNLIVSSTTSVLFVALSRAQNDKDKFEKIFFSFQRNVGLLVLPLGVGIFLYRDLVTQILLGSQWMEAADFIGLWGLVNAFKIVLSNYCSEAYRAMGKPKVSMFVQMSQLIFLVPLLLYGARKNFEVLYVMRCLVSLELILINLITIKQKLHISNVKMLGNVLSEIIAAVSMVPVSIGLCNIGNGVLWECLSVIISAIVYFSVIYLSPWSRAWFIELIMKMIREIQYKKSDIRKKLCAYK